MRQKENKKILLLISIFVLIVLVCVFVFSRLDESSNNNGLSVITDKSVVSTIEVILSEPIPSSTTSMAVKFPKDLNLITKDELMAIDGIGVKTATSIVDYRTSLGSFDNLNQLLNVDGIGDKTFDKLKKCLFVENESDKDNSKSNNNSSSNGTVKKYKSNGNSTSTTKASRKPSKKPVETPSKPVVFKKININSATYSELMLIKGVGDAKAKAIINYRKNNGYFYSIKEIKNVDGIGSKNYEVIKDYILVDVSKLPPKKIDTTTTTSTTLETDKPKPVEIELESVNLNTATYDEFMKIPKIEKETIDSIINYRINSGSKFKQVYELERFIDVDQFNEISKYLTI